MSKKEKIKTIPVNDKQTHSCGSQSWRSIESNDKGARILDRSKLGDADSVGNEEDGNDDERGQERESA